MKKIFLFALAAAFTANASAEGYQVNTLSAKQLGMAHTGVSQKLNSESLWFNPAAAAFQDQKFTIAGGVTGIAATATWTSFDGSNSQESDNKLSTPLYLNLNYKINDDLAVGISVNTPYGSSMNWGNDSWAGSHLIQDISLQSYCVQPTISYKLFNDKLSIGAGVMISWGSVELSKSLFPVGDTSNTALGIIAGDASYFSAVGDNPLSSLTMNGDAGVTFGVNVGLMYDISDKWIVGASYRSKMMMEVDEGTTSLDFYNETIAAVLGQTESVSIMQNGTFSSELPLPSTFSAGVSFYPNEKWKVSAEMQMVGWSTYESLDFLFTSEDGSTYENNSPKCYENTFIYRLGTEFQATEWLTARAGIYYDESPVVSAYFAPETPSMNKIGYTCGVSLMPLNNRNFSIDLAYGYISPASYDRSASYTSVDGLQYSLYSAYSAYEAAYEAAGDSETASAYGALADSVDYINTFGGKYRAVAHTFSVGLSWGF